MFHGYIRSKHFHRPTGDCSFAKTADNYHQHGDCLVFLIFRFHPFLLYSSIPPLATVAAPYQMKWHTSRYIPRLLGSQHQKTARCPEWYYVLVLYLNVRIAWAQNVSVNLPTLFSRLQLQDVTLVCLDTMPIRITIHHACVFVFLSYWKVSLSVCQSLTVSVCLLKCLFV